MWILTILTFTFMTGDKHFEASYKTKAECYEALDSAAKYIPNEQIRYIGCTEK